MVSSDNSIKNLLKVKAELRERVGAMLTSEDAAVARKDPHASRSPRACGITVHPGLGCPYQCKYCYIYDMGFSVSVSPYPLTGLQLVYSLLSNECFVPGTRGTYLAIGSVTEPLHPIVKSRTFEYIEAIYNYLSNPVQFSTKSYISSKDAEKLAELSGQRISPLVTVATLEAHKELEPYAPPVERRLEAIRNLREAGLQPFLFLRPIIPGITEREYREIVDLAVEYGAVGVVAGSLRVTRSTLSRLKEAGIDVAEIVKRLEVSPDRMAPRKQYNVNTSDIKGDIARYSRKAGLMFYPSACMANLHSHGLTCWKMRVIATGGSAGFTVPSPSEVCATVKSLGVECKGSWLRGGNLYVRVKRDKTGSLCFMREALRAQYQVCVKLISS